ncbi:hypothetical protein EV360DRAFT_83966 [Lentinula raphanica]|nr:hypothetical protein EV360DRAFT_83966 [Lentinula raphanica]
MQNTQFTQPDMNPHMTRIPVEIWTEIFSSYYDLEETLRVGPSFFVECDDGSELQPYRLQAIIKTCRNWHDIVYSNPKFWSSFLIDLDFVSTSAHADTFLRAFSRSGNAKLRLEIIHTKEETDLSPTSLASIRFKAVAAMLEQAHRWCDVNLYISAQNFQRLVKMLYANDRPPHGYFPNLERLDCSRQLERTVAVDFDPDPAYLALYRIFDPCPALEQLHVFRARDSQSTFKYSLLTSLDIETFEGSSLAPFLFQCPCLRRFSIAECHRVRKGEDGYEDPGPWSVDEPFCHQSITTLRLPTYHPSCFQGSMWKDIRLPFLDTLQVEKALSRGDRKLFDMLLKSGCNLQTLILGEVSSEMFRGLLCVAPSLKLLTLDQSHFDAAMSSDPYTINQYLAPLYGSVSSIPVRSLSCLKLEICPWIFQFDPSTITKHHPRQPPTGDITDNSRESGTASESEAGAAEAVPREVVISIRDYRIYTLVNRLRLMIQSRSGASLSVRIRMTTIDSEFPLFFEVDVDFGLPGQFAECFLDAYAKSLGLIVIELSWDTTAE